MTVRSLGDGEELMIVGSEDRPLTAELLTGRVEVAGGGPLSTGEIESFGEPVLVTAIDGSAMLEIRTPNDDEED